MLLKLLEKEKDKREKEREQAEYSGQDKTKAIFFDCRSFVFGFHLGDRQPEAGNKTESGNASKRLYPVCKYGSGPRNAK